MSSSVRNALVDLSEIHECSFLLVRLFRFVVESWTKKWGWDLYSGIHFHSVPLPPPSASPPKNREEDSFQFSGQYLFSGCHSEFPLHDPKQCSIPFRPLVCSDCRRMNCRQVYSVSEHHFIDHPHIQTNNWLLTTWVSMETIRWQSLLASISNSPEYTLWRSLSIFCFLHFSSIDVFWLRRVEL